MPKQLRNGLFALVLALGAAVLGLEFAARSIAARMADSLAPIAVLSYANAGVAFDGSVRLDSPRLELREGLWRGTLQARIAHFRAPDLFWLIQRGISGDPGLPSQLSLDVQGLQLPGIDTDASIADWLTTPDLVLFETEGCGSDALTVKDRARMGIAVAERHDRIDYHYDHPSRRLELKFDLESPSIAALRGYAEFDALDPSVWTDAGAQRNVRVARAELSYRDPDYLAKRNAFCAQWLGIPATTFVERHVAAVDAFLATRGIEPSAEVRALYQQLVGSGGALNLASLPSSAWVPAEIDAYPRSELLRLLNITARHNDAQPIMLRLAFKEPEEPLQVALAAPLDDLGSVPLARIAEVPVPSMLPISAEETPAPRSAPLPAIVSPAETLSPTSAPATRAAVADSPDTQTPSLPNDESRSRASPDAGEPGHMPGASAPPPPKDSALAMVWRPGVIERLPPRRSEMAADELVGVGSLAEHRGRRVRLVTTGGKRVEGRVLGVDATSILLTVQVGRGNAELSVPRSNVVEARLVRARTPSS